MIQQPEIRYELRKTFVNDVGGEDYIDQLSFDSNMKILEIGSGVGATMKVVASISPNTHFFGVDINFKQNRFAKNYLKEAIKIHF